MEEFKWIEDLVVPELSDDAVGLLSIIDEFDSFPNNFVNSRGKRFEMINNQMVRIVELGITNGLVADVSDRWLRRLESLLELASCSCNDRWGQERVRKRIKKMKRDIKSYSNEISNSDARWYDFEYSSEEILNKWRGKLWGKIVR